MLSPELQGRGTKVHAFILLLDSIFKAFGEERQKTCWLREVSVFVGSSSRRKTLLWGFLGKRSSLCCMAFALSAACLLTRLLGLLCFASIARCSCLCYSCCNTSQEDIGGQSVHGESFFEVPYMSQLCTWPQHFPGGYCWCGLTFEL